jgi:long-chain acyl-CoA synthetase
VLSGGFNIYSKEVEDVLRTHPAVADAAVIGVPDAMYGEAVAAFVELRADMTLDAQTLIEFTRTDLAGYKKPKHVWFMPLPRNSIGKVTKNDLRDEAKKRMEAA